MAEPISPVPNNQPVTDRQGMISQIWSGFFNQLWSRAGGSSASSNTQLQVQINAIAEAGANTIKGNNTGSPALSFDLSPAQVNAMLPLFTNALKGLVPLSGGGAVNFLRADGSWAAPVTSILDYFVSTQVTTTSASLSSGAFTTASNSPAFTFVPNFTGKYRVYASIPTRVDGAIAGKSAVRIFKTSGSGTLVSESQAYLAGDSSSISPQSSIFAQSVYTLTAGVSYVFDLQGSVIAGTGMLIDGSDSPFYMFAERVS